MTFDETNVNRDKTGRFGEKTGSAPAVELGADIPRPLKMPFKRGDKVVLPAGTVVASTRGEDKLLTRKQTVTAHMVNGGYYGERRTKDGWVRTLVPPTVTWAGSGGYWMDARVDADVLAANGLEPEYDERAYELHKRHLGSDTLVVI